MRFAFAIVTLALFASVPARAAEDAAAAVRWDWRLVPATAGPGSEAELVITATLAPRWVVYSSDFQSGLGPLPARLRVRPGTSARLLEPLRSVGAKRRKDPAFDGEYGYFSARAELRQRVRLAADGAPLEVTLSGQACHEVDGTCHLLRQDIRIAAR